MTVDLSAIAANVGHLRAVVGPAQVWAVVKADGYGHGAVQVGRAALAAGATKLCVATWEEGRSLRDALPGTPILVMGPLVPGEEEEVAGVEVTVSSLEGIARLRSATREMLDVHVKVDTGMGRWGMRPSDALRVGEELAQGGGGLRLAGLMSHLASADSAGVPHAADAAFTDEQLERFAAVSAEFPPCTRHVGNSAAALRVASARWDAVRCGVAVLGLSPFATAAADDGLIPALRFTSYVADIKQLQAGESAGYGRRLIATEATWIGLAPVGYADGVPRILSGQADVVVRGVRRRVAATISMDQLTFVIGSECDVELGDMVTLIGDDGPESVTTEEWARLAGTINYEIVTGLEPQPRRVDHVFTRS